MTITLKDWNQNQKVLRTVLDDPGRLQEGLAFALTQHGWTHESAVASPGTRTFADQLWDGLTGEAARIIPPKGEHSIAWIYFHLARIEDTTMNLLVAGQEMVLDEGGWLEKLNLTERHTGNLMMPEEITALSQAVSVPALRDYRIAVGLRTQEMIASLTADRLKERVRAEDIETVRARQAVLPEAEELLDYWGKRTIAGLLLMPATRHNMVHINEALRIKKLLA